MIHGIALVERCPACGNGIILKNAGRNECHFEGCSREAAVYITEEQLNARLVPELVKELDGYKKALIKSRQSRFVLPNIQRMNDCFVAVPQFPKFEA
jgi:hypothetical protein